MDMPLPDVDEKHFARVLAIKQQMAQSIFTTTARVRDTLLRPGTDDGMSRVLAEVRAARGESIDLFS